VLLLLLLGTWVTQSCTGGWGRCCYNFIKRIANAYILGTCSQLQPKSFAKMVSR
jgi:hypothetical protein